MSFTVSEMEAAIRSRLNEPTEARITSDEILRALNDGYKDVPLKALCFEREYAKATTVGERLISFRGHRVNFIEFRPEAANRYMDKLILYCTSSIASGAYWIPAPAFSMADGIYYMPIEFPLYTTITSELPVGSRSIYYTTDGTEPTTESILYDEGQISLLEFLSEDNYGTLKQIKAVVYAGGEYSPVTTLNYYKDYYGIEMGSYKYGDREFWCYDVPALTGGRIDSGAMTLIVVSAPADLAEPNLLFSGGIISIGALTEIVVLAPADLEEPVMQIKPAIINQGKYWDPIVEIEPPWN